MDKRKNYLKWQEYFMAVAHVSAMRSKDPNTQVGAVVVNSINQIVSTGYNGFPRGVDDEEFPWSRTSEDWKKTKYPYVAHAELNAIVAARSDLTNCHLYVNLFPCNECAKIIIQAGISKVFYLEDKYASTDSVKASKKMFESAKVEYNQLPNIEIKIEVKTK
ncbi:deoxycytidylate deaminase [Williamsoniiplasma somnilux]|uniref:Deoxycytidylate deaminase n=1 Tax=Williamsoniiplasma somnilux TaxID=215578 RepID=A0A2K8NYP3_9MOLU|nr:dCMP deaminase family protein [Williamsoniiplasma somnilux]ATZ18676.1 deoxycytidylate deaminase [Williamsoniiplasma somnilux]